MSTSLLTDRPLAPTIAHEPITLATDRLEPLARQLTGPVLRPGDVTWDEARLGWNRRWSPQPLAIVRAAHAEDVVTTVRFVRDAGIPLTIRSGGHSLAGHGGADGALMLDLGGLRSMTIDPEARIAHAGPGLTAGAYSAAVQAHGLATPHGDTASVGLGGLTLGGGIGWLVRAYGLTIDSLVSAELVTADGELMTVDADSDPELFWGLRGGGGNLGIVTRFSTRLHPVQRFLGGAIALPLTRATVRGVIEAGMAAPDGLTLIPMLTLMPPLPFVAPEDVGSPTLLVLVAWTGDIEAGQRALAPIRALAPALGDMVAPMPYPAIYSLTEPASQPTIDTSRSAFLSHLDDDMIEGLIEGFSRTVSSMPLVQLRVLGGAMGRVAPDATAFAHRDAPLMAVIISAAQDLAELPAHEAWVGAMHDVIAPASTGAYVNFLHREGPDRIRAAYPGATYDRLVALKRRWDPTNLFRSNQNVAP